MSKLLCKLEIENKQHINSWSVRRGRMMYTTFATVPCYYHLDLFSDILTKTWATVNFCLFFNNANTRNVRWRKMDLIVRHVSYFKFAARAIKPHFHATFGFFFFLLESKYCLRYGKTGNKKLQLVLHYCCKTGWTAMLRVIPPTENLSCNRSDQVVNRFEHGYAKQVVRFFCYPFFRTFSALRAAKP